VSKLAKYVEGERVRFEAEPEAAKAFLAATGEAPLKESIDQADLAATTLMVRLLLGFSETTFKP
jgi:hypothetical protein